MNLTKLLLICFTLTACDSDARTTVKVSHKGYEDNKLSGFVSAINDGFTILGTDVRLRDGEVVLLHDDVECTECDTLDELMLLAESNGVTLWVETKEREVVLPALSIAYNYNVNVMFTSFTLNDLKIISENSSYDTGLIKNSGWLPLYTDLYLDWLIIGKNNTYQCPPFKPCAAWTIKTQAEYDALDGDVNAIIMDEF